MLHISPINISVLSFGFLSRLLLLILADTIHLSDIYLDIIVFRMPFNLAGITSLCPEMYQLYDPPSSNRGYSCQVYFRFGCLNQLEVIDDSFPGI